jgi:hypothetical protein
MDRLYFLLAVAGFAAVYSMAWLLWRIAGRAAAVSLGLIPLAAQDYLVLAWKAERKGRWADARMAYEQATRLDPTAPEVRAYSDDILTRQPGPNEGGEWTSSAELIEASAEVIEVVTWLSDVG